MGYWDFMGREATTILGKDWDNEPMDMNHNIVTILGICTEVQTTCMVVSQIRGHSKLKFMAMLMNHMFVMINHGIEWSTLF
jgi:hypothetical protein